MAALWSGGCGRLQLVTRSGWNSGILWGTEHGLNFRDAMCKFCDLGTSPCALRIRFQQAVVSTLESLGKALGPGTQPLGMWEGTLVAGTRRQAVLHGTSE